MSVNVLGQTVTSWSTMKPEFSMLALKPNHLNLYKYDLSPREPAKPGSQFLPPSNTFLAPSSSDIIRPTAFSSRASLLPWPAPPRDSPARLPKPVASRKTRSPGSPRSPSERSPHNIFPNKSPSEKTDYSCHRPRPAQMNGLDKVPMTGNGSSSNSEHLSWLADVAASSRAAVPPTAQMTPQSSPSRLISPAGAPTSMLARDEATLIHTTTGSLFRPPITSVDGMYAASQFPGHPIPAGGAPLGYYNPANQLAPHYGTFYSSTYSPTRPYHQSPGNSPGLLPQQFFQMDAFPSGAGMEGAMIPTQLPHSRPFAHGTSHSAVPPSPSRSQLAKASRFSDPGSPYEQARATQVLSSERTNVSKAPAPSERHNHQRSSSSSTSPTNGVSRKRDLPSKESSFEVPSLKHRILRPANITIMEPPSSVMAEAPLSAPPHLRAGNSRETISKHPRFSIPVDLHSSHPGLSTKGQSLHENSQKNAPTVPNFVPNQDDKGSIPYPTYFVKGSIIQLGNDTFQRVENLTTEDFMQSAGLSPDLCIDTSTVVKVRESLLTKTALLGFSVGKKRVQVSVNAPLEHPFFVFNRGWSSCSPERTLQQYGLVCHKLKIGDVCISLTRKSEATIKASTPTATVSAVATTAQSDQPKHTSVTTELPETKPSEAPTTRKRRSSAPADLTSEQAPSN